jgi:lysozyme family protein
MLNWFKKIFTATKNHAVDKAIIIKEVVKPSLRPTVDMWVNCILDPEQNKLDEIKGIINKALTNAHRYWLVAKATGVPVWVVFGIHFRESSMNFLCNMVNGQPLNRVTTIVPIGVGPWPTWEDAAIDAFKRRKYDVNWSVSEWLDFIERYNGIGYRSRGLPSPYVWGYTNQSDEHGKYIRDHVFDYSSECRRPGVAALLTYCIDHQITDLYRDFNEHKPQKELELA